MPNTNPIIFFAVSFSLKAKLNPMHTEMIPKPLNNGNRIIDGTCPARLVMIKLITQREMALPTAHGMTARISFLTTALGRTKKHKIKNATTNEYKLYALTLCSAKYNPINF